MKLKTLLTLTLVLPLSSPLLAAKPASDTGKEIHSGKRIEQQQVRDERRSQKAAEMEQRQAECENNSASATCSGWQKGRHKAVDE